MTADKIWRSNRIHRLALACMCAIAFIGVVLHFYDLSAAPRGFYVDESSIAYNAWMIARSGMDEHGEHWPLFFRAFGEYKNPLYIYLVAGMYRLAGYSEWVTRATSALCWLTGSALLFDLGRRLFADTASRFYLILCLCFTPWLFSLSRISFELIVLFPLLALHLLALHQSYEQDSGSRDTIVWAAIAGLSIGLTVYAYSTFRLLAPLHALIVLLNYPQRRYWRRHAAFILMACVSVLPFAIYLIQHGDNLLERFNGLSYLSDASMSLSDQLMKFGQNYLGYFSLDFLAGRGDPNLRHHSGYGGQLLTSTFLLLTAAIAWLISTGKLWKDSFTRLLAAGCLLAPLAAALTRDEHHSLRSMSLAIYAVLLSVWAVYHMTQSKHRKLAVLALALTACNAVAFTKDYFSRFTLQESAHAFEGFGFKEALETALANSRGRVLISQNSNQPYIQMLFYTSLMQTTPRVPVLMSQDIIPGPDDLLIRFDPQDSHNRERWHLPPQSQFVIIGQPGLH
ncbi:MAG: hypothetical protein H6R19_1562 [Proteobacteria bacterium]|nr:hypothetical protein [Pseudomonadota bacterium]